MPTPTIFEGINPRGTQTLIPCRDKTAFPRSEQAVLGALNQFDKSKLYASNSTITQTADGIELTVSNRAWASGYLNITDLPLNSAYKFSSNVEIVTAGTMMRLTVNTSKDGGSTWTHTYSKNISSNGKVEVEFNTLDDTYFRFFLYATDETAADADIIFGEIMLTPAAYNGNYVDFAMTNRELTELKEYEMTTSLTLNSDGINKAVRNIYNAFVSYKFVDVTLASYGVLGNLPKELRPSKSIICPFIVGGNVKRCIINADGNITSPEAISNTWVELNLSYMVI